MNAYFTPESQFRNKWRNYFEELKILDVSAHDHKLPMLIKHVDTIEEARIIRDAIYNDSYEVEQVVQFSNYASGPSISIIFKTERYEFHLGMKWKIYKDSDVIGGVRWKEPSKPETKTDKHYFTKYFFTCPNKEGKFDVTYYTQSGAYRYEDNSERFLNTLFLEHNDK